MGEGRGPGQVRGGSACPRVGIKTPAPSACTTYIRHTTTILQPGPYDVLHTTTLPYIRPVDCLLTTADADGDGCFSMVADAAVC